MNTTLSTEQAALVRVTFKQVAPLAEQVAALFYGRLFELDPSLRALFRGDQAAQGKKLMAAIATVVAGAEDSQRLRAVLEPLAVRHVGYGVEEHHYAVVGAALLWTLEQGLGDGFSDPVREAWTAVYGLISGIMIDAAGAQPLRRSA